MDDWQTRDIEDLAALFTEKDPRSLSEMIATDQVSEYIVEKATRDDNGWEISFDDGLVGFFRTDEPIKAGDTLGLFCDGRSAFGSMRHGFSINGKVIEYKTPWERYADRIVMLAEHDRRHRETADESRRRVEEWIGHLRGPYRDRIERFIARDPMFVIESGMYETYPVLMGQRVETWVREQHPELEAPVPWDKAVALVKELESKPYEDQAVVLHAGQGDEYGVSGHQVDSAFGLAAAVLSGREV